VPSFFRRWGYGSIFIPSRGAEVVLVAPFGDVVAEAARANWNCPTDHLHVPFPLHSFKAWVHTKRAIFAPSLDPTSSVLRK